jgi:hypothetical protein
MKGHPMRRRRDWSENWLFAAFIHVSSELAFILNSARP